jgi:hypothetical protein
VIDMSGHARSATAQRRLAQTAPTKPRAPAATATHGTGAAAMATWGCALRGGAGPAGSALAGIDHLRASGTAGTSVEGSMLHQGGGGGAYGGTMTNQLAGTAGDGGGVDPLRRFEDFCNAFPIDKPQLARAGTPGVGEGRAGAGGATTSGGGGGGAGGHVSSPSPPGSPAGLGGTTGRVAANEAGLSELQRADRDLQHRRAAKESAQKSYEALRRTKVDKWAQLSEKHNRKLRKENEVLSRIAAITQEASLNNDLRYEEAVGALKAQLEYTGLYRSGDSDTMAYVREAIAEIQDRLDEIQSTSERQVTVELTNIRTAFERQVHQKNHELEDKRAAGQSTTEEWVRQCRSLQQQLEELLRQTDAAYSRHKQLHRTHQRLRIENDAQSDDAVLLARQWSLVSAHHARLQDRVQELELALAGEGSVMSASSVAGGSPAPAMSATPTLASPRSHQRDSAADDAAHAQRLGVALQRGQALLATEQQNLEAVRRAHIAALKQRTELEVYLRCAVLRHQQQLTSSHYADRQGRRATTTGYETRGSVADATTVSATLKQAELPPGETSHAEVVATSFTGDDRRVVVEALLSVPRVLELLYRGGEKLVPVAAARDVPRTQADNDGGNAGPVMSPHEATRADLLKIGAPAGHLDRIDRRRHAGLEDAPDPDEGATAFGGPPPGSSRDAAADEAAVTALWQRWQRWTTNAADALEGPPQRR